MSQGDILPLDTLPPPQAIAPSGSRFSWDEEAKYVQWMGFTFYLGFTYNRGMSLYDIRHKGERIIYELSLQEALAHYSGTDPVQSTTAYLDVSYGLGAAAVPLVPGYDCPSYVRILICITLDKIETTANYFPCVHAGNIRRHNRWIRIESQKLALLL